MEAQVLLRQAARTAGYAAKHYAECPYVSGQKFRNDWHDGFIARCVEIGSAPDDTPMYLLGRIAYMMGKSCTDLPASEQLSGRWFSGWLAQRDATPMRPNIS